MSRWSNEKIFVIDYKRIILSHLFICCIIVLSIQQQVVSSSSPMFVATTRKWTPFAINRSYGKVSNTISRSSRYFHNNNFHPYISALHSPLHVCKNEDNNDELSSSLKVLEKEIFKLANTQQFNVNSSRQVASFVFLDNKHSASRKVLQDFVEKHGSDFSFWTDKNMIDERRRVRLAEKVLEWREIQTQIRKFSFERPSDKATCNSKRCFSSNSESLENDYVANEPQSKSSEVNHDISTNENVFPEEMSKLDDLFCKSSKIDPFWKYHLGTLQKPSSKALLQQLHRECPIGFNPFAVPYISSSVSMETKSKNSNIGKKGSLLGYVRDQKKRFSDKIILTKVGEFYEAFGIDAILLVEHCGLNSMAEKARAGCPLKNIQATLDSLTSKGFSVAIYEEAADTDSSTGPGATSGSKSRLKSRFLGQLVSPANPTYMYGLVMSNLGLANTPARPYIGVLSLSSGYTLIEVSIEERSVRILERLTSEAVACHLQAFPPAEPLLYMPPAAEAINRERGVIPFLSSRSDASSDGPGSRIRIKFISPILRSSSNDKDNRVRSSTIVLDELLRLTNEGDSNEIITKEDFTILNEGVQTGTAPLFLETAGQLGLMFDPHIPSLVHSLLPDSSPAACRRFLRRWLLTPPPPDVANSMAGLVSFMKDEGIPLPQLIIPPIGKTLSVIRARQASAQVFREICGALDATTATINQLKLDNENQTVTAHLVSLIEFESGFAAGIDDLRSRCDICSSLIKDVIISESSFEDSITDCGQIIPKAFFERNEIPWRGRVKRGIISDAYEAVDRAANQLTKQVQRDFWGPIEPSGNEQKSVIVQDIFNNIFAIKSIPIWVKDKSKYYHPRDRRGQFLKNRYTTESVEKALVDYIESCERASIAVAEALSTLSDTISDKGHLPAVVQSAHANVILSVSANHASSANAKGWNIAECNDNYENYFSSVWPYWMDKSQGVSNSFTLDGIFLLTAPNMSGKSTLMRSVAATALLTSCGLCSPVEKGTTMKRFDRIFIRGASADVPSEGKSAFGAEMGDIASLLRQCGMRSLIFVDEIGRGTSPRDGTCLAGAVLEEIASLGMTGIFATHLHGILKLPLKDKVISRLHTKRMAVDMQTESPNDVRYRWKYKLEDGVCTNSLALITASQFGVPNNVLIRAAEMSAYYQDSDDEVTLNPSGTNQKIDLDVASAILKRVTGSEKVAMIPSGWTSPSSLEGLSCVYVLEVGENYYVGETDNLSTRISQHRAKGGDWNNLRAAVAAISGGKTVARNIESNLIRQLSQEGFTLVSVHDGKSITSIGQRTDRII